MSDNLSSEGKLRSVIFKNYVPGALPSFRPFEPVQTKVQLYLNTVYNLDMKNQKLSSKVHILVSWKDESLKWNETLHNGLQRLVIPLSGIWKPDILLTNLMEDKDMFKSKDDVLLDSKGTITWSRYLNLDTYCRINTTFYPFDNQTCDIVFSKQYTSDLYHHIWHKDSNNIIESSVSNGEWNISNIPQLNSTRYCDLGTFTDLIFRIEMKRNTKYYYWIYVMPIISLAIVDVFTFCLPVKSQEKLNISLFVFLSLVYLVTTFNQSMPSTSDNISKFGTLLWSYILISGLIILWNIIIITVVHRKWTKFMTTMCKKCNCWKGGRNKNKREDNKRSESENKNSDDDIKQQASIQTRTGRDLGKSVSMREVNTQTKNNDNTQHESPTNTNRDEVNQYTEVCKQESEASESTENLNFIATIMDVIGAVAFPIAFIVCFWLIIGHHFA